MTPRRSKHIDTAVTAALRDVAVLDSAIAALHYAARITDQHTRADLDSTRAETHAMHHALHAKRGEALMRAMQFGSLTANPELRTAAFKAATEHLARQYANVVQYLEVDGVSPGSWATALADEFRAEIKAAFAELEKPA